MSKILDFILGHSAGGSLAQAFPHAKIVCMADHLDVGPCRFDGVRGTSELVCGDLDLVVDLIHRREQTPRKQ